MFRNHWGAKGASGTAGRMTRKATILRVADDPPQGRWIKFLRDLAVQSEGRSVVLPHCPPAVYCPLAAIGVGAGAASERAIVAQLVPAAEIH